MQRFDKSLIMNGSYTVEQVKEKRILTYILLFIGIILAGVMAFMFQPFDPSIIWAIPFWAFLITGIILAVCLIRAVMNDLRGKSYRIIVDGENITFIDGNKQNSYSFSDITEVTEDHNIHPDKDTLYICFGKYEYYPLMKDMKNADRLMERLVVRRK